MKILAVSSIARSRKSFLAALHGSACPSLTSQTPPSYKCSILEKIFMTASGMAKKVGFDSATLDAELIRNMDFALFQVALA